MSVEKAFSAAQIYQIEGLSNGPDWDYQLSGDGVEWRDDEGGWHWLCQPIEVVACTRDGGSENWGRQLNFTDRDGVEHQLIVSAAALTRTQSNEIIARLAGLGFVPPVSTRDKNKLVEYILTACPTARLRVVGQIGWENSTFVLPTNSFGANTGEEIHFQSEGLRTDHSYQTAGDLTGWQERIAAPSVGNSRLVFAISCAFVGPLLVLLGEESGGFNLRGSSSIGKSTALKVAASVWGGGTSGFIRTWRATDNGLEGVAVLHCDTFLALDEISQVESRVVGSIAYMLANGQGKSRAGKTGEARQTATWRVLFLSTGEISLADKVAEGGRGQIVRAGQEVRVLDIPADPDAGFGLFDHVPKGVDSAAFADELSNAASEVYGTPSLEYLDWLCANMEKVKLLARSIQAQVRGELAKSEVDGQVKRAAGRFALVAAAGELATQAGVVGWKKGEASQAVTACFNAWLEGRGGTGPAEIRDGIRQVRLFLEKHGASRFQDWDPTENPNSVYNRLGFVRTKHPEYHSDKDGYDDCEKEYFILAGVWRSEFCRGFDAKVIAKALVERGILIPGNDGKPSIARKVPSLGKTARLYRINSKIFEAECDG